MTAGGVKFGITSQIILQQRKRRAKDMARSSRVVFVDRLSDIFSRKFGCKSFILKEDWQAGGFEQRFGEGLNFFGVVAISAIELQRIADDDAAGISFLNDFDDLLYRPRIIFYNARREDE